MRSNILEETERIDMRTKTTLLTVILLVTLGMLLAACGSKAGSTATQPSAPAQQPANKPTVAPASGGDGEALLNDRCTKCHSLDRVTSAKKSAADWESTVTRMVGKGAKLTSEEQKVLVDYLAKTYGP
jgi:cytochrome c5